ncbi:hypothetical protein PIB30_097408 [Stylosanthes scabra]|uniref:Uncharacterized protein n=1 Tax=Stylosanthes scabra TaxID=79078 RepID=A0ABU6VWL2_9FABA|nr:hypothetical protein [Stylosanthes scabra]
MQIKKAEVNGNEGASKAVKTEEEDCGSGLEISSPTPEQASDGVKAVNNSRAVAQGYRTAGARCDGAVMEEHDSTTTVPEETDATKLEPEEHYEEQMNMSWLDGDSLKATVTT